MNSVGIDVSKGKSMVAIVRPFGEVVAKSFEVLHTPHDINQLMIRLSQLEGDTRVVMEHTGRYYEPIAQLLTVAGFHVSAVNPKLIKDFGNNSLRKVKTDKKDALKIARYALDNWTNLRQYSFMDEIRDQLKTMNRQFVFYVKQKTAFKNNLIALLDLTYPGANAFFTSSVRSDGSQKWLDFVSSFWHVDCVRKLPLAVFTELYQKWCEDNGYHFQAKKAEKVWAASKELLTLFPKDDLTKQTVKQAAGQLKELSMTVEQLRAQMNQAASKLPEYPAVMAMDGVGPSLGPQLIAEIGDITRFSRRSALTAFAGVDPGANQSGGRNQKSVRTSKRGSPHLRRTLFLVMDVLLKTAPEGNKTYEFITKKQSEGKPYYVYMTAGANKFLRIYYGKVNEYLASLSDPK